MKKDFEDMTSVQLVIYYGCLEARHKFGISDEELKFIMETEHAILDEIERRTNK